MAETQGDAQQRPTIEETAGMRAAFWSWAGVVAVGLAAMIALPLTGR